MAAGGGHGRRSLRLKGYDYSRAGAYFVTIVTHDRACALGGMADDEMRPNEAGSMVVQAWKDLPLRFPQVRLDAWVLMPNHLHGILVFGRDDVGAGLVLDPRERRGAWATTKVAPKLGEIVGAFKSITTVMYTRGVETRGWARLRRLWQRNSYEHVVRDQEDLDRLREYIAANPAGWAYDRENLSRTS